ncbi:hypothetical protein FOPE_07716 [Fonsecaea pedrosoi]|nr:hypothetical protein FOPE_07716 [Fonsecaea pedrosoi]
MPEVDSSIFDPPPSFEQIAQMAAKGELESEEDLGHGGSQMPKKDRKHLMNEITRINLEPNDESAEEMMSRYIALYGAVWTTRNKVRRIIQIAEWSDSDEEGESLLDHEDYMREAEDSDFNDEDYEKDEGVNTPSASADEEEGEGE